MLRRTLAHALAGVILVLGNAAAFAATHDVTVGESAFVPANLTVQEGDTVRWTWQSDNHNVVSGVPFTATGAFESLVQNVGGTFEVRFDRRLLNAHPAANNRYHYYCEPHAAMGMVGSVRVLRQDTNLVASLAGWQVVAPTTSDRTGTCNATLSADESSFVVSCSHNAPDGIRLTLRRGFYGDEGSIVCSFAGGSTVSGPCSLSSDDIDLLLDAGLYFELETASFPEGAIRGQLVRAGGSNVLTGAVQNPNGGGVQGAVVTDGVRQATTGANGGFALPNVPNGVVRLSASSPGLNIAPLRGVSPSVVNGADVSNRNFSIVPDRSCGTDTDLDGSCDAEESESDPDDPGSARASRQLPLYALWNGFLQMTNILELVNRTGDDVAVTVHLHDIDGVLRRTIELTLRGYEQRDLILNGLPEFTINSYGLVVVTAAVGTGQEPLDGRISYYRSGAVPGTFDFAFSVPLTAPSYGRSSVGFNTFQPSRFPPDAANEVSQWLGVVNLDRTTAKQFTIYRFNEQGVLLATGVYTVPPFARLDIEGGHVMPGASKVGQHVVIPHDVIAPYIVQLFRYGTNAPSGVTPTGFDFALPTLGRAGNGRPQRATISTGGGGENWVELINAREAATAVTIEFFDNSGTLLSGESFILPPFAQRHFNAGAFLGSNASGSVRVTPSARSAVVGQSMFYFRDAAGRITTMYGTPLRESFGDELIGSYNLFLGMYNWLKLTNLASTETTVSLTIVTPTLEQHETTWVLPPLGGVDLGLHELEAFGTAAGTYGLVRARGFVPGAVSSELLRVHPLPDGTFDFAVPTSVR